jgi:hypothetical protein
MDEDLKARLLKPRLPEADVDVPGVGTVRVRGLNRAEAMIVQGASGPEATERRILALGMVDPPMTEAEVGQWQKASPGGEIEPVSTKIAELSGMLDGAAKEVAKSLRSEPDA